jgi:predicted TIM-barrel fold metal-dependent hydrolase
MDLSFFDCNAFIGSAQKGTWRPARGRSEMLAVMDAAGIDKALIWHIGQQDWSIPGGNTLVSEAVAGQDRLWGCWTILPPQTDEIPEGDALYARMKDERIRAVRIFPANHRFVPSRTALGKVLDGLAKRGVPLFLSVERGGTDFAVVDRFLQEFPRVTCVLCDVGIWGVDRYTRPLLERFPRLFLETSYLALHDGVLEETVRKYGSSRLLFGSAFPDRLPASAMLPLRHANITDDDKRAIASGNLERLLERVKL